LSCTVPDPVAPILSLSTVGIVPEVSNETDNPLALIAKSFTLYLAAVFDNAVTVIGLIGCA